MNQNGIWVFLPRVLDTTQHGTHTAACSQLAITPSRPSGKIEETLLIERKTALLVAYEEHVARYYLPFNELPVSGYQRAIIRFDVYGGGRSWS